MDRVAIYLLLFQIVFVYAVVLVKLLRVQVGVVWEQGTYTYLIHRPNLKSLIHIISC